MKRLITLMIVALLAISSSYAQERGTGQVRSPEERTKMQVQRLTKELNLSQAQQDSIYKYSLQTAKDQQEMMKNAGEDRAAMREKMKPLREKSTAKIKSFLNAEQKAKYEEMQKQMQNRSRPQ